MENAGYLFVAFTVIWALVFGFVFLLFMRQRRLMKEIDSLKQALSDKKGEQ